VIYSVVIPTLNEKGNVGSLVRELKKDPRCSVIVCDNGSTDGTQVEAKQAGALLIQRESGSVSDAIETGIEHAIDDLVIVMDADGSHPASLVPPLTQRLVYHDMVYGYREKSDDGLLNRFISAFGKVTSYCLGPSIKDRMTGFFGIKKNLTRDIKINSGPKPFLEYVTRINPTSIEGLPFEFKKREIGLSKLGRKTILFTGILQLLKLSFMKYTRLVKYTTVGGVGTLIYLSCTIGAHELTTIPYYIGAMVGGGIAFIWNFSMHKIWTYAEDQNLSLRNLPNIVWNLGHDNDDGDFDWWEWSSGLPHKKFKRTLGRHIYELAKGDLLKTQGGAVLSLGCGSSPILNMFDCPRGGNKLTLKKVGVDVNPEKIYFFKDHVDPDNTNLLQGDIRTLTPSYLASSTNIQEFDLVLCNEVVEHFHGKDLTKVLELMRDSVKTDGSVIISTPDTASKSGNFIENFLHGEFHVGMLDAASLIKEVEAVGLQYVESRNYLWDKIHLFKKLKVNSYA
jgi:glycosyltransferase involved in cell wall biosynthesis